MRLRRGEYHRVVAGQEACSLMQKDTREPSMPRVEANLRRGAVEMVLPAAARGRLK